MNDLFNGMIPEKILFLGVGLGLIWSIINDIIYALCDFIRDKGWKANNYEKLILKLYNEFYDYDNILTNDDLSDIYDLLSKYDHINKRKNKLKKLFNKKNKK